jgi:ankyrin repeat protein
MTPLMVACRSTHSSSIRVVETMVRMGCLLDLRDEEGRCALDWALSSGHQSKVDILCRAMNA